MPIIHVYVCMNSHHVVDNRSGMVCGLQARAVKPIINVMSEISIGIAISLLAWCNFSKREKHWSQVNTQHKLVTNVTWCNSTMNIVVSPHAHAWQPPRWQKCDNSPPRNLYRLSHNVNSLNSCGYSYFNLSMK